MQEPGRSHDDARAAGTGPATATATATAIQPRQRTAARGWTGAHVIVVAVATLAELLVLALIRLTAASSDGGDLCQDAAAMQRIVHGQPAYAPTTGCGTLVYLPHPPASLLLVGPVTLLPIGVAAAVWDCAMVGAMAAILVITLRELRAQPGPGQLAVLLTLVVCWPPLLDTLLEAQIGPVLLLLATLAWRWARRGRLGWAGVALGLAAGLRLFPALAVVYFAARREWRALAGALAGFMASALLALPLVGVGGYVAYITHGLPGTQAQFGTMADNLSLWGWAAQTAPGVARLLGGALVVALVGILAMTTLRRRRWAHRDDDATLLAYLPAMVLASPLAWSFYVVLALVPILFIAVRLGWLGPSDATGAGTATRQPRDRWAWWRTSALLGGALALVWLDRVGAARDALGRFDVPMTLSTYALALVVAALLTLPRTGAGDREW